MEKNEDEPLDEQFSTETFLCAIAALRMEMEKLVKPNRFMVMRPFEEDEDMKLRIVSLETCYNKISVSEKKYIRYLDCHLLDTTVDENDEVHKLLNVDRIVLSFLESLNYYEINKEKWSGLVSGFEVFGKRVMSGEMIASCFRTIFEAREKAVELFRRICRMKVCRQDAQVEEIFEKRLRDYSIPRQYTASYKYRELRKNLPKESADKEFLGDLENIDIVKLYKRYKGDIAKLFNNIKMRKIVNEDLPSLLEYVMRKRIVITYLEKGGSQSNSGNYGDSSTLLEHSPFSQYVFDPSDAPYTIQFLHEKINNATKPEIIACNLKALILDSVLYDDIPLEDLCKEFKRVEELFNKSNFSKLMGAGKLYSANAMKTIAEAHRKYINEHKPKDFDC